MHVLFSVIISAKINRIEAILQKSKNDVGGGRMEEIVADLKRLVKPLLFL